MDNRQKKLAEALQGNDQGEAAERVKEYLDDLQNTPLVIAITGESVSGKSTFVNALRGIDNKDEEAAPTDVVETTMEPTEYSVPNNCNIKLWDLPGVGTTKFTAKEYMKKMEFERFDFFIIISSDRFKENDAKLAQEIKKMGKKFYFVRSKIDNSIRDHKRSQRDFTEEKTLQRIRDNCTKELVKLGIQSPVFLISSFELHLYEFNDLWKTLEEELPALQRDALLLALPNINLEVVKQKIKVLEGRIKWYAFASAAVAVVLILVTYVVVDWAIMMKFVTYCKTGTSVAVDCAMILQFVTMCQTSLGLTHDSLLKLSWVTKVPIEEIKKELKSQRVLATALHVIIFVIKSLALKKAVEEGLKYVEYFGTPISMCISGFSVYICLRYLLKTLGDDAHRVFIKAMRLY